LTDDSALPFVCRIHTKFSLPLSSQAAFAETLKSKTTCAGAVEWLADAAEQATQLDVARASFEELKTIDPIRRLFVPLLLAFSPKTTLI
jgi:hypothetical protein